MAWATTTLLLLGAHAGAAAAAGAATATATPARPPPASDSATATTTLGTYDFETGESTPFVWHGKLLMMESISFCFPDHLRVWKPELYGGAKCPSYIRVRDMATGVVVSNITSSCNHTFGAAVVEPGPSRDGEPGGVVATGGDTLRIFTARCARFMVAQSFCKDSVDRADAVCPCWHGDGPGSDPKNCAIDVFSSTDPALSSSSFTKASTPFFPQKAVANVDVTAVPHGASPPDFGPALTYVMVLEKGELVGTSSAEPTSGWRYLNASANATGVGCPTIRYSQTDRLFYVLGGGQGVRIQRSRDLVHWEAGGTNAMLCGGPRAPMDRRVIQHAGIFNWQLRDIPNVRNFTTFVPAGSWDKFASDLDVTEWEDRTLVAFICGDQRTTGMAMLAEYDGSLDAWLASHFATPPNLMLHHPVPPLAFLPMGAVVTIHPLLAPQTALRHCYHDLYATAPGLGNKEDYDFVVEAGLGGAANTVSFRSLQIPTLYIHVDDPNQGVESNRISVDVPTSKAGASWLPVPVTKAGSAVSWRFRSSSSGGFMGTNGRLIGHCGNRYPHPSSDVVLLPATSKELDNSTFHVATVAHPPPTPPPGPPQPPPPAPPHLVHSKVTVDTSVKGPTITPHMTGCGLEDINHELNGGLYSQMVLDESFETTTNASLFNKTSAGGQGANSGAFEPTSSWRAASGTAGGAVRIVSHPSLCFNGPSCLEMMGPGKARVTQSGLLDSGLFVLSHHNYTVSLSLALGSGRGSSAVAVTMSLVDRISGKVISNIITASCSSSSWTRFSGVFDATASSANASLSIAAEQLQVGVSVRVDMVLLEPGAWGKFRGLPVRRDLAELIQLEQLTVMRLGGGMIDSNGWNWHHQIGPREARPPNMCGSWDAVMSNGWGVFDFLNLAEELKIRPIVSVHLGTITAGSGTNASAAGSLCSPSLSDAGGDHDSGAFANVSDPSGYIEYLFGPAASTRWGAVRAQDGHPEPYRPFTMALSNEEGCGAAYQARAVAFMAEALARASQLPSPPLLSFAVACDGARFNHWRNDASTHAMTLACANLTEHYPPHLLEILWDQHVNGDELDAPIHPTNFSQVFNDERLATRGWGLELPVVVLEENGNLHTLQRALGHLRNAFAFQAMGEHVLVQCYANCFQPVCHEPSGDCVTHYSQGGKMFLPGGPSALGDANRTWLSPHGWSTQMLSASYRPQGLRVDITGDLSGPAGSDIRLHAMAAMDENDETSTVVRVLNPTANVIQLVIDVVGDRAISIAGEEDTGTAGSVITVDTLSGETLSADNSWESPLAVHPVRSSSISVDAITVGPGGAGGTGSTGKGSTGSKRRALMMINHTLPPLSFAVFTLPATSKKDRGSGSGATADVR